MLGELLVFDVAIEPAGAVGAGKDFSVKSARNRCGTESVRAVATLSTRTRPVSSRSPGSCSAASMSDSIRVRKAA